MKWKAESITCQFKMETKNILRTLRSMGLVGLVALANGCANKQVEPRFNGEIAGNKIKLTRYFDWSWKDTVEVYTTNQEKFIFYGQTKRTLLLSFTDIKDEKRKEYDRYSQEVKALQPIFEDYVNKVEQEIVRKQKGEIDRIKSELGGQK